MTALEELPVAFTNETNNLAAGDGNFARSRWRSPPWFLSSDVVDNEFLEDKTVGDPVATTELVYVREEDLDGAGEMDDEASLSYAVVECQEGFGNCCDGGHIAQGNESGDGEKSVRLLSRDPSVESWISEISSKCEEVETDEAVSDHPGLVLESQNISYDMTDFKKCEERVEDSSAQTEDGNAGRQKLTRGIVTVGVSDVHNAWDLPVDCTLEFKQVVGNDGEKLNNLEGGEMRRMEFPESCVSEAGNDSEPKDKLFSDDNQDTIAKDDSSWPRDKTLNNDTNINITQHESSFDVPGLQKLCETESQILGRHCYSRIQLESLRYVDVKEQQRRWKEIYQGLGPVVTLEYNNVLMTNNHKQVGRNNDRRLRVDKKKDNVKIHADSLEERIGNNLDITYPFKVAYGDNDSIGKCKVVEQPSYEDDDSDEEYDSIQRRAFLVDGEPNFESGPPQDGLEYLRRVRWEAAKIPKVKVAELAISKCNHNQTPYMPKIPDIPKCPENLSPLKHWEDAFVADFSKLRQVFSSLENSSILQSPVTSVDEESDRLEDSKNNTPTLRTILGLDAVARAAMLRKHISTFESSSSDLLLSRDICRWLFALCVAVDTPLNADMSSSLRCLLRKCSSLLAGKSEQDDEVAMLNVLVAISGKYFGQSENCSSY